MDIKHYFENTDLTQVQIAAKVGVHWKHVFKYIKNNYSSAERKLRKARTYRASKLGDKNPMFGVRGDEHHYFVGDVSDAKGYLMRLKPDWYTGRAGSKHVFVHSLVMCAHYGITEIPKGWCVHHVDCNPHNNTVENLMIVTLGDHQRIHRNLYSATTISKESTAKWLETHGTPFKV